MLNAQNPLSTFISLKQEFLAENPIGQQEAEMLSFEEILAQMGSLSVEDQEHILDVMNDWCKDHFNQFIDSNFGGEQSQKFWDRKRREHKEFVSFMDRVDTLQATNQTQSEFGGWFWQ